MNEKYDIRGEPGRIFRTARFEGIKDEHCVFQVVDPDCDPMYMRLDKVILHQSLLSINVRKFGSVTKGKASITVKERDIVKVRPERQTEYDQDDIWRKGQIGAINGIQARVLFFAINEDRKTVNGKKGRFEWFDIRDTDHFTKIELLSSSISNVDHSYKACSRVSPHYD